MKTNNIIFWISTIILFLFEGVMPLESLIFAPDQYNVGTKPLGYPDYFAVTLIIFKVLGAIALIIPNLSPRFKEWVYAGFTFNLIFAVISHIVVDKNIAYILMPIIVLIILMISYITYHKRLKLKTN